LQDVLIEKIDKFLSPYLVEDPKSNNYQDGLSIFPTRKNIALVSHPFIDESELILFQLSEQIEGVLKNFME
jgi:hypothetical protein